MVVRKLVTALAVATGLVLGTTGCSLTHNIPTLQEYAPSDGTQGAVDGVKALNVIYLTKFVEGGSTEQVGGLIGTFVNTTGEPAQVRLQFVADGSTSPDVILNQKQEWVSDVIAPGGKLDLGYNQNPALTAILLKTDGKQVNPGSLVSVWFAVNDGTGIELRVPALDGSLEQYAPLVEKLGKVTSTVAE